MTIVRLAASVYYTLRPLMPRRLQIGLRRGRAALLRQRHEHSWPVNGTPAAPAPPGWPGWPGGKRFALVLTHDVETREGVERCERVAAMELERGMRSAFAFVPRRYRTPPRLRDELRRRGFGVMVHGLYHDGKLFATRSGFEERADAVNEILEAWDTRGFATPAAHHDFRWMGALDIDYDVSSYDNDPFEPQGCGLQRVFPFWVAAPGHPRGGFVELPYTLAQDFTAFVMLRERGIDVWRRKLDWLADSGGMALLKTHPDYMAFSAADRSPERYPAERYGAFLDVVRERYGDDVWIALPHEVAAYWREVSARSVQASGPVPASATFCASCRAAHARGQLLEYLPAVQAIAVEHEVLVERLMGMPQAIRQPS